MAASFKRNFIESNSKESFSTMIFTGWDFAIIRKGLANLNVAAIRTQLRVSRLT